MARSVNVDTPEKPKRKWWKKKRWAVVLLLLLAVAYPLSSGPAVYAKARGWLPRRSPVVEAVWMPLARTLDHAGLYPAYIGWCAWWARLGWKHDDTHRVASD
jgi:hypothetical protein